MTNKAKIEKLVGKELYIEKTKSACAATVKKAIEFEMAPLLSETIDKAEKAFPEDAGGVKIQLTLPVEASFISQLKNE